MYSLLLSLVQPHTRATELFRIVPAATQQSAVDGLALGVASPGRSTCIGRSRVPAPGRDQYDGGHTRPESSASAYMAVGFAVETNETARDCVRRAQTCRGQPARVQEGRVGGRHATGLRWTPPTGLRQTFGESSPFNGSVAAATRDGRHGAG